MTKVNQPSLLYDAPQTNPADELESLQKNFNRALEHLNMKVGMLIEKMNKNETETKMLKDTINELKGKIQEYKIELTKKDSDLVLKDKEISNLKNMVFTLQSQKSSIPDKDGVKNRIKELIARIDTHLENQDDNIK
jgi:chromosome segregation ATPase